MGMKDFEHSPGILFGAGRVFLARRRKATLAGAA
jgi:hypothetical protein